MQTITVTVHGAPGVLDLAVPANASVAEVARVYGDRIRQPGIELCTVAGVRLDPGARLTEAGVRSGAVLVAGGPTLPPPPPPQRDGGSRGTPESVPRGWFAPAAGPVCVGVLLAVLTAVAAATQPSGTPRLAPVLLLAAAAVFALVPLGPRRVARAHLAPVLAAAAALAWFFSPEAADLPAAVAAAGLAGGAAAGLARATRAGAREAQVVWMGSGVAIFVLIALNEMVTGEAAVTWAVLFVAAALAPRWIPSLAVVVPDRWLVDLDRFAVTAWSARDHAPATGAPGASAVDADPDLDLASVTTIAARAERVVTAAAVAVLVVAVVTGPLLLWTATVRIDQIGALCVVGSGALALLLGARDLHHRTARGVLRLAGLAGLVTVGGRLLVLADDTGLVLLGSVAVVLAFAGLVLVLLLGRERPSARWSRIADLAETGSGTVALGAVVVAVGIFRHLWTTVG